jgi:hypothetical protein
MKCEEDLLPTPTVLQASSKGLHATPALLGHRFASFFTAMMPNLEHLVDEGYHTVYEMHLLLLDGLLGLERFAPSEEGAEGECAAGFLTVLCDPGFYHPSVHTEGLLLKGHLH